MTHRAGSRKGTMFADILGAAFVGACVLSLLAGTWVLFSDAAGLMRAVHDRAAVEQTRQASIDPVKPALPHAMPVLP